MSNLTHRQKCKAFNCNRNATGTYEIQHEDGSLEVLEFCKPHGEDMAENDGFLGWKIINYWGYVAN